MGKKSNFCLIPMYVLVLTDNTTLTNLLPGVVDGTVELVLRAQGPEGKISLF